MGPPEAARLPPHVPDPRLSGAPERFAYLTGINWLLAQSLQSPYAKAERLTYDGSQRLGLSWVARPDGRLAAMEGGSFCCILDPSSYNSNHPRLSRTGRRWQQRWCFLSFPPAARGGQAIVTHAVICPHFTLRAI